MVPSGNFGCTSVTKLSKKKSKEVQSVHKKKTLKQANVVSVLKMEAVNRK